MVDLEYILLVIIVPLLKIMLLLEQGLFLELVMLHGFIGFILK